MYEPLAVDIFTDKNKKDPPSAHVSSVFVCKLGSRVFRVLPKVLWSQRPPFCLVKAQHEGALPPPCIVRKGKQKAHQNSNLPMGRKACCINDHT